MIDSLLKGWRKSGPLGAMALHALASYKRIKSTSDNVWPSRDTFLHRLVWLPRSGQQGLLCACLDLWRRMRNLCIPWKNLLLCNPSRASPESEIPCRRLLGQCSHETKGITHGVDRKSVVEGKSVSVRVDLGGRRIFKKKKKEIVKINMKI